MSTARRQPITVLLVDDQPIIAESIRQILLAETYIAFHHCANAEDAVDMAIKVGPTVILQDLVMPGVDGLELVRDFKRQAATCEIPLIVLSTKEEPKIKASAFRWGANDYLVKLPSPEELIARIRYHSEAYRNATQRRLAMAALAESREQLRLKGEEIAHQAAELAIRNRFIQKTFGRYLSDDVVSSLLDSPEGLRLGGETREVTIMMADLRGFTSTCEALPPSQVMALLNSYLGAMSEVIGHHHGTINEFIGDAILALFGAPLARDDDVLRAARCAVSMQHALEEVNRRHLDAGLPAVEMGIALHTGEVVVGNIGSQVRAKYGVVGSNVNLTSRIESMTVGGQVLVSEATRLALGEAAVVGERLDISAKGLLKPVVAWDLLAYSGPEPLVLSCRTETLTTLSEPIVVEVSRVRGKQVDEQLERGCLVSLSASRAVLQTACSWPRWADLRIRVHSEARAGAAAQLWCKVLDEHSGGCLVQFAGLSSELGSLFKARLDASLGQARKHTKLGGHV